MCIQNAYLSKLPDYSCNNFFFFKESFVIKGTGTIMSLPGRTKLPLSDQKTTLRKPGSLTSKDW